MHKDKSQQRTNTKVGEDKYFLSFVGNFQEDQSFTIFISLYAGIFTENGALPVMEGQSEHGDPFFSFLQSLVSCWTEKELGRPASSTAPLKI